MKKLILIVSLVLTTASAQAAQYEQVKSQRTHPTQGVSRRNKDDLLFRMNLTAAKLRHDLSRLARKVWVTTKKAEREIAESWRRESSGGSLLAI